MLDPNMRDGKANDLYGNHIQSYFHTLQQAIIPLSITIIGDAIRCLGEARDKYRHIFIFGNGGSAATAAHMANDLNKLASASNDKRFKAVSLTENVALMTAWANDSNYEDIFAGQLRNFMQPGDVAIGISTSGNSMNVVNGLKFARENGGKTILLGGTSGGKCSVYSDIAILVSIPSLTVQEDIHLIVAHIIASYFKNEQILSTE